MQLQLSQIRTDGGTQPRAVMGDITLDPASSELANKTVQKDLFNLFNLFIKLTQMPIKQVVHK